MAITKSAKKALRQSKRKKVFNEKRVLAMRSAIKGARRSAAGKANGKEAAAALAAAYQAIDKAMKRGILKKNAAARKKSQLAKAFKA